MADNLRILVLGGTSFIGRAIAGLALAEGAAVTLFTRGKTGPGLFPQASRLTGDRDTPDYNALSASRDEWDAVVDTTGYLPRHVNPAMDVLGDRVGATCSSPATRSTSSTASAQARPRTPPAGPRSAT